MSETTAPAVIAESESGRRFTVVDALRGIAALAVLFHHLLFNSELQITLWDVFPRCFSEFCHNGAFGVEIFFVLSGFVITHSLRNVPLTARGVGNFMLRRQLRLDPPYWTLLILTVAAMYLESRVPWMERKPLPTWLDFGTNMFYLQNIFVMLHWPGSFSIMGVAWTLCLEVQFYIVFILLLLAGKYLGRSAGRELAYSAALVTLLGIVSPFAQRSAPNYNFFVEWWFYFAAGVLCYWAVNRAGFRPVFIAFLILVTLLALFHDPTPILIGAATALLLYTAGRMGALTRWLDYAPLQYLGKISYSLYLSHLLVAIYVLRLGYRLTGNNHAGAVFWFLFAGLVSIGAAHVMYLLVERPSVRFAARFKPSGGGGRASSIGGEPAGGNWVASGPGRSGTDDLRVIPIDR